MFGPCEDWVKQWIQQATERLKDEPMIELPGEFIHQGNVVFIT